MSNIAEEVELSIIITNFGENRYQVNVMVRDTVLLQKVFKSYSDAWSAVEARMPLFQLSRRFICQQLNQ